MTENETPTSSETPESSKISQSSSTTNIQGYAHTWEQGDLIKGQVPKMVNPPPPPSEKE